MRFLKKVLTMVLISIFIFPFNASAEKNTEDYTMLVKNFEELKGHIENNVSFIKSHPKIPSEALSALRFRYEHTRVTVNSAINSIMQEIEINKRIVKPKRLHALMIDTQNELDRFYLFIDYNFFRYMEKQDSTAYYTNPGLLLAGITAGMTFIGLILQIIDHIEKEKAEDDQRVTKIINGFKNCRLKSYEDIPVYQRN